MTSTADVKTAARRVLEEIFPADDEAAVIDAVTDDFINHEAPAGTPPGPAGVIFYMHALAKAFSDQGGQWQGRGTLGRSRRCSTDAATHRTSLTRARLQRAVVTMDPANP